LGLSPREKVWLIDEAHENLSVKRQAELLGVARSTIYYQPKVDRYELELMHLIDEQYTETPFYGTRRMTAMLNRKGHQVNRKRVQRLMREMGLEAVFPRPRLSQPQAGHPIYPYLLRGLEMTRANQVWGTDITCIRMSQGWLYCVAMMDWFSRYIRHYRE
jgi:putative transposase